jgi:hypothetical protein
MCIICHVFALVRNTPHLLRGANLHVDRRQLQGGLKASRQGHKRKGVLVALAGSLQVTAEVKDSALQVFDAGHHTEQ